MDWNLMTLDTVDSTSSEVRRRAALGAAEGLAVLAGEQTAGRGRQGRPFASPGGQGLYLSALLRPKAAPRELLWLTAWTAVAVCDAVEALCGVRPGVKWVNDLVLGGKKLCGILCERSGEDIILGIGVNLTERPEDFPPALRGTATSILAETGTAPDREAMAGAILAALGDMYTDFPAAREEYHRRYRASCVTLGRQVRLLCPEGEREGFARDLDADFGLLVDYPGGETGVVTAGEVSVRGLYGYAE